MGPVGGYNMSALFFLLLNLASSLILMRELFSSRRVILFAALLASLSSYLFLKLDMGFLQKLCVFWMPLYLWALLRLWRTRRTRYAPLAALFLLLTQFSYPPYALFLALGTVPLSVATLFSSRRDFLWMFGRLSLMAGIVVAVSVLLYSVMGYLVISEGQLHALLPDAVKVEGGLIDVFNPFFFNPYRGPGFPADIRIGLSLLAVGFGVVAVVRGPGLARVAFAAVLLFLLFGAGRLAQQGGPHHAPDSLVPILSSINLPFRLLAIASLFAAIAAGYGLQSLGAALGRRSREVLLSVAPLLVLLELGLVYGSVFPPELSKLELPRAIEELTPEVTSGVLYLPETPMDRRLINLYGFYASLQNLPMVNRYYSRDLYHGTLESPGRGATTEEWGRYLNLLADLGVRRVVMVVSGPPQCPTCRGESKTILARVRPLCAQVDSFPEEGLEVCHLAPGPAP